MKDARPSKYRERCFNEKEERCVICSSEDEVQVHHVDGDRSNDNIENLVPVCSGCHSKIHSATDELSEWGEKLISESEKGVREIRIIVSPEQHERMSKVKDSRGYTWKGLLLEGTDRIESEEYPPT